MKIDSAQRKFLLAAEGVNKEFSGFKAITNLNFYLDEGELRTVIGPNGAGKTTFLEVKVEVRYRLEAGELLVHALGREEKFALCGVNLHSENGSC